MKKFVIYCLIIFGSIALFKDYVQSGKFERFLDAHPTPQVSAPLEYWWGMLLDLASRPRSAEYRFRRVVAQYPATPYAPRAWAEIIGMYYDNNLNADVIREGELFLKKYPTHREAAGIRRKIEVIQHGI